MGWGSVFGGLLLGLALLAGFRFGLFQSETRGKHADGLSKDNIDKLYDDTRVLEEFVMVLDQFANGIKQRAVITQVEAYGAAYSYWRDFVDRINILGDDFKSISLEHRKATENLIFTTGDVIQAFVKGDDEQISQWDKRISVSMFYMKTEFKNLLSEWQNLLKLYMKAKHDNSKLMNEATQYSAEHLQKHLDNTESWTVVEKILRYSLPPLLIFGPAAPVLGPLVGASLAALGPLGTALYHILDTFQFKPGEKLEDITLHSKYRVMASVQENFEGFLLDNISSISTIYKQIEKIISNSDLLTGDEIRHEFVQVFLQSMHTLSKYTTKTMQKHVSRKSRQKAINA